MCVCFLIHANMLHGTHTYIRTRLWTQFVKLHPWPYWRWWEERWVTEQMRSISGFWAYEGGGRGCACKVVCECACAYWCICTCECVFKWDRKLTACMIYVCVHSCQCVCEYLCANECSDCDECNSPESVSPRVCMRRDMVSMHRYLYTLPLHYYSLSHPLALADSNTLTHPLTRWQDPTKEFATINISQEIENYIHPKPKPKKVCGARRQL